MEPKQKSKFKNYTLATILAFGNFWLGYHIGILNPLGDKMLEINYNYKGESHSSQREGLLGLLNNLFSLGALAGVLLTGVLADKIGRLRCIKVADLLGMATAALFLIGTIHFLLIARTFAGIVAGIYSSIGSIIISELLPNSVAGFGNALGYFFVTFSILIAYLIPVFVNQEALIQKSNLVLFCSIIVPTIRLILMPLFLTSETPKYIYNSSSDKAMARKKMTDTYSKIYREEHLVEMTTKTIENLTQQSTEGNITFKKLFQAKYRRRTFSGMFLSFAQQMSGINYLILYSTQLFRKSGKEKTATFAIGLANVFGSLISLWAIRKYGRKFNIIWGCALQGFGMLFLFLGCVFDMTAVLFSAIILYISAFAVGLGGSQMAYISEILPPIGVSLACAVQWIMTALLAQIMLPLNSLLGSSLMMVLFACLCFCFFFSLDYLMIETKDKSEDRITNEFEMRRYSFLNFS